MSRITINIGFHFEGQHYAQMQAYIPRSEALNTPELQIEAKQLNQIHVPPPAPVVGRKNKNMKEEKIEQSQEESEEQVGVDENQMDIEDDNGEEELEVEEEEINIDDLEAEKALKAVEDDMFGDSSSEDKDEDEDEDLSSISGFNTTRNNRNSKTKRQKGEAVDFMQLPDRRPRKDKKLDEAGQIIRREEKERKRKQYLKKQIEAQEKATLQKILNETGKKLKMREQKQLKDQIDKDNKKFRTLGDAPKIITNLTSRGKIIMLYKTSLFSDQMLRVPNVKHKGSCISCGRKEGKYRIKGSQKFACSAPCLNLSKCN